jgi:signal transduction histidine kinase
MSRRVLCIESDPSTRARVRRLLEAAGLDVEDSAGALDGLARARASVPDLVLADTRLPDIGGVELAARLKQEAATSAVPVVALGSTPAERELALAGGCDGFIEQPFDDTRFAGEVSAFLDGKRERARDAAAPAPRREEATPEQRNSAFVHDLAHELATPLTPLSGYLKILQSERLGALSPQQRKVVEGMAGAVAKLTRIIDNLADFASLQAGASAITPSAVDPDALAEEVVNEVRGAARDARLRVDVRSSRAGPVLADGRKLRQALANVVQNAVKFSPHGGEVLVDVSRDGDRLRFAVYDQGPGVPASAVDRIFEPFRHGDRTDEARVPGSGLGLPVARRIAEAHGGRIVVESPPHTQPGVGSSYFTGSKFVIELPARPAAAPPQPTARVSG